MGQQQRERVWSGAGRVHHVHSRAADLDPQMSELVETGLQRERVERLPVGDQVGKPVRGHTLVPRATRA
jgi:hypothetical protein